MIIRRNTNSKFFRSATMTVLMAAALVLQPFAMLRVPNVSAASDAVGTITLAVMPNPSVDNGEYVRMSFAGTGTLDLSGWKLGESKANPADVYSFTDQTLTGGQSITLCGDRSVVADCTVDYGNVSVWNNSGDAAVLFDEDSAEIMRAEYTSATDPDEEIIATKSVDYAPTPPADTEAPVLSNPTPADGATVSGNQSVNVTVTDDTAVESVKVSVRHPGGTSSSLIGNPNGKKMNKSGNRYSISAVDSTRLSDGAYDVVFVATDTSNNVNSLTVRTIVDNDPDPVAATAVTNVPGGETYDSLQEAVDAASAGDTLRINENLETSEQVTVDKALTIDGGGYTLDAAFFKPCKNCNDNNSAIGVRANDVVIRNITVTSSDDQPWPQQLHGINVYESSLSSIIDVTVYGFEGSGVVIGKDTDTTIDNITAYDNGWHDINVDKPNSNLSISGSNSHSVDVPHIYVDDITVGSVDDADDQYDYQEIDNYNDVRDGVASPRTAGLYTLAAPADTTSPVITSINPTDGDLISKTILVQAQIDDESDIRVARARLYGSGSVRGTEVNLVYNAATGYYEANVDTTEVPDGTYRLRLTAKDMPNNAPTVAWVNDLVIDNTVPAVTFISPVNNAFVDDLKVSVDFDGTGSNLDQYGFDVSGPAGNFSTRNYTIDQSTLSVVDLDLCAAAYYGTCDSSLPDGEYRIRAKAYDKATNRNISTSITVAIDNTAPAKVSGMSVETAGEVVGCDATINNRTITVNWDDVADADYYQYQADRNKIAPYEFTTNVNNSERPGTIRDEDGTYNYRVRAVDMAGNAGEWSQWCGLTLDRSSPTADAGPDQNVTGTSATLTGSSNDATASYTWTQLSGPSVTAFGGDDESATKSTTVSAYGTYVYQLTVTDPAGNTSNDTVSVVYEEPTTIPDPEDEDEEETVVLGADTDNGSSNSENSNSPQPIFVQSLLGGSTGGSGILNPAVIGLGTDSASSDEEEEEESTEDVAVLGEDDEDSATATTDTDDEDSNEGCWEILGLCWYWWVVIILAVLVTWYVIRSARRRDDDSL